MNREYLEYLGSEEWMVKRGRRLAIGKGRCAVCGVEEGLQVHHLTYERIFREEMGDLLPLCERHHEAAERLVREGKLSRVGDVLFLATETVRLILMGEYEGVRLEVVEKGRKVRVVVNGMVARGDVQVEMLKDVRFVRLLGLGREQFKRELERLYGKRVDKGRMMSNGFGIYGREHERIAGGG